MWRQPVTDMFERSIIHFKNWSYGVIVRAIALTIFGIAGLCGAGFIVAGSYFSLSEVIAPWAAGLVVGSVLLVVSLIGVWIIISTWHKTTNNQTRDQSIHDYAATRNTIENAEHLGEIVGTGVSKSGARTIDVMIAALVAGTILGAGPSIRKRLSHRNRQGSTTRPTRRKESAE